MPVAKASFTHGLGKSEHSRAEVVTLSGQKYLPVLEPADALAPHAGALTVTEVCLFESHPRGCANMFAVAWEIEMTAGVVSWYRTLDGESATRVAVALDRLEQLGPGLGRPFVDSLKGSRHHNMKELRSIGGNLRMLFAFDPRRHAVVLVGGDKTGDWRGWYARSIPVADRLYDNHLRSIRGGGQSWQRGRAAGARYEPSGR